MTFAASLRSQATRDEITHWKCARATDDPHTYSIINGYRAVVSRALTKQTSHPLRWHLLKLALLSLIPAALFSAVILVALWQAQERERLSSQFHIVHALADAVDDSLASAKRRARLLASIAATTKPGTLSGIAREVLADTDDLWNIILLDPSGQQIFNAAAPVGMPLPRSGDRVEQRQARERNETVVSGVFVGRALRQPIVDVIAPLPAPYEGYLLLTSLKLSYFDGSITHRDQRPGSLTSLLDRELRIVARSVGADVRRGEPIAEENAAVVRASPEGSATIRTKEGLSVYSTWTRTREGWTVAYGAPVQVLFAPLRTSLAALFAIWLLIFALSILLALQQERKLEHFLQLLFRKTENLEAQATIALPHSGITEVDEAMKRLRRTREALQAALLRERSARQAAEYANDSKDTFLAMLGHELRNPLSAIVNASTVLRWARATPKQRESMADVIHRQAEHLSAIVNDMLQVGRVMQGKIDLRLEPVNLASAVRHVLDALYAANKMQDRDLVIDMGDVWVRGDTERLQQVVLNLLINAVTYTERGQRIVVTTGRKNDQAVLVVQDVGIGISANDLMHIFDLFFQAQQQAHRPYSGLGIGLTLVKKLVELHGGNITVGSQGRGHGATFTVMLPSIDTPAAAFPIEKKGAGTGVRQVLIVDDNDDARHSLKLALELAGHHVVDASHARAALSLLDNDSTIPEIGLLDIGLPDIDGYELARMIRARYTKEICLIAVTGYGAESDKEKAIAAGFDAHITKPVDLRKLHEVIDEECQESARTGQR